MKLCTLNLAITHALSHPEGLTPDELKAILGIHDQIVELRAVSDDDDIFATIASTYSIVNLLNVATYDVFGRLLKKYEPDYPQYSRRVKFEYRDYCRSMFGELTNSQIDDAADFLLDLWRSNEEEGSNNPDGSFNKELGAAIYLDDEK